MIFSLFFISFILAEVPDCPPGKKVPVADCTSIPGCFWQQEEAGVDFGICIIQCNNLSIADCNDPKATNCFWDDSQGCIHIWDCDVAGTESKCTYHPRPDLSCIWDNTDPSTDPFCRDIECYDYDTNRDSCNTDENLNCIFDKRNWCRRLQCTDFDTVECSQAVGGTCKVVNGTCIQHPCDELTSESACLTYGFCHWYRTTQTCEKVQCENASNQDQCESKYMEIYIDTCAWSEGGGCYRGSDCRAFTTKTGCLIGGGPCVWTTDKHCVDQ